LQELAPAEAGVRDDRLEDRHRLIAQVVGHNELAAAVLRIV
jgi:hypothetical protein